MLFPLLHNYSHVNKMPWVPKGPSYIRPLWTFTPFFRSTTKGFFFSLVYNREKEI